MHHPATAPLFRRTVVAILMLLTVAATASAQVIIKVNDNVNFKLGILLQGQADFLESQVDNHYGKNLFARRARLLFGGQVAPKVTFFVETDAPNLGKTTATGKNIQPSMYLQDAFATYKASDAFSLDMGLMLISPSRNGLQSAASLLPIDYGAYTFAASAPTQSTAGRDTGVQARGYFNKGHFEYRVGAFQGLRDARSENGFRGTARVMYNFLDAESGYFYTGTYLGKKKVLALGGGLDVQSNYRAYAADLFFDHPLGGGALTTQVALMKFDGGTTITSLPEQQDVLLEAGYLFPTIKLEPVIQYVSRNRANGPTGDENRYSAGVNYWLSGHNANLKFAYSRISPKQLHDLDEFTVQFQLFYF